MILTQDVISCVALYYEMGKSGSSFLRNEISGTTSKESAIIKDSQRNSYTDGTTARAEHEGLGANVWCRCTSALSVRQETTIARAGTLPLEHSDAEEQQENEGDKTEEDGVLEYNSPSSDEDVNDEIPSLDGKANFLLGTVSRFRRTICSNNRTLFVICNFIICIFNLMLSIQGPHGYQPLS